MKPLIHIFFVLLLIPIVYAQKKEALTTINNGLQMKDIHSVILKNRATLALTPMSYSSTLLMKLSPYLLLKDGTIYSRPYASPHDLDVSKSKQTNPSNWGKWSKASDGLHVQFKKPQIWSNYYKAIPANKNQIISGTYKCSGSFKLSNNSKFNTIIFKKDGSFILRYFYKSDKKFIPHSSDSKLKGNYTLNNYTIEMNFSNGQKERFLIALFAKGAGMVIGSKSFAEFEIPDQFK